MITEKVKFFALAALIAGTLNLFELVYMKYTQNTVAMNGFTFDHIGMLVQTNPADKTTFYIPIYRKR